MEASLFTDLLCDALRCEEPISMDMALKDIPEWDSMAAMVALAMAEQNFNKKISLADLETLTTVSDLYALLTK